MTKKASDKKDIVDPKPKSVNKTTKHTSKQKLATNTTVKKPKAHKAKKTKPVSDVNENNLIQPDTIDDYDVTPYTDDELLIKSDEINQLHWRWSEFELRICEPITINPIDPPQIIMPAAIEGTSEFEYVYPIQDFGSTLITSKGEDLVDAGMSMCKLHYTIEKMIYILVERLKDAGIDESTNVPVEIYGHELVQRKAFESIINLLYNVVVTNFDPGDWGNKYLNMVKLIGKNYGYPPKSPRFDIYHRAYSSSALSVKKKS